ncbi:MAG TPA: helix-turn-helix transcriptional regulator [Micromonosporaceae bacterium]|nr:helix-turn-helix transcriptional regulator [Micromonosporaceae bacterium]
MRVPGPLMPRRKLAAELRRLRDEAHLSLEDVAAELLISTSKLSRLENAQGSPQARDVRDLIKLYKVTGTPLAEDMMRWVSAARQQAWWADYTDVLAPRAGLDAHVAYESEARVARIYTIPVLPILLQTPDYIRAAYRAAEHWRTGAEIEQLVKLRLRRQEILTRDKPPPLRLVAITHEVSLRQVVGSAEIMRVQLHALVEQSTRPNIELRVLPFTAPPAYTIGCMYGCYEFDNSPEVLSIETHAGFRHIETPTKIAEYRRHFSDLEKRSLTPDASRELITSIAASFADTDVATSPS